MAKAKIGTTFLGPQKGLSIVGSHCYAFSGETSVADSEVVLLEFVSPGKRYLRADFQIGSKAGENEDYEFKIYLNGSIVFSTMFYDQGQEKMGAWPITLIIPPGTEVKTTLENIINSNSRVWTVHIAGRVYD